MPVTSSAPISESGFNTLLKVARKGVDDYLSSGHVSPPDVNDYGPELTRNGACFVTLTVAGQLQGCLGTLAATQPLISEVYDKAFSASHQDPRFSPLIAPQLSELNLEVSVLSPMAPLPVKSESELLEYLSIHKPGLVLHESHRRAVFLPQVWEQLPEPVQFLLHLKRKGGWPDRYWSDNMQTEIFTVSCHSQPYHDIDTTVS